jgi:hypothetical protein
MCMNIHIIKKLFFLLAFSTLTNFNLVTIMPCLLELGTQSNSRHGSNGIEHDIGTSDIEPKRAESDIMSDIVLTF